MSWNYNETPEFVDDAGELELSQEVRDALKSWAETVKPIASKRNRRCFMTPANRFSVWNAKIPDPDSNKGSSGGFRLVYFIDHKESLIYMDKIEKRAGLGFGDERPKDKRRYDSYLLGLEEALKKLEKEQGLINRKTE